MAFLGQRADAESPNAIVRILDAAVTKIRSYISLVACMAATRNNPMASSIALGFISLSSPLARISLISFERSSIAQSKEFDIRIDISR